MKNSQKLEPTYGRLTVKSERSKAGRRVATVQCECGRTKDVLVDSLLGGRTKSCGRGACKTYPRVSYDPTYHPSAPRSMPLATVISAWKRYNHPIPAQRRTVAQVARLHKLNANTLMSVFRSVRRAGGIDAYLKKVKK